MTMQSQNPPHLSPTISCLLSPRTPHLRLDPDNANCLIKMINSTKRTSTYESYCRERKSFLDHDGDRESELMAPDEFEKEELVEIISFDESCREKATAVTEDTEPLTECQSWSLSSNSIITAWYENDDGMDRESPPSRSIQSYASDAKGMFSPLYEVTSEHTNVFRENRRSLPKAGRTPKFGSLSYKEKPQNHDLPLEVVEDLELEQSKTMGSTSEQILESLSKVESSVNALQTKAFANKEAVLDDVPNRGVKNALSNQQSTSAYDIQGKKKKVHSNAPRTFEAFLRGEWSLDPLESTGSGELSLEPVLEVFDSLKSVSSASAGKSDCFAMPSSPLFTKVTLKHVEPEVNTIIDAKRKVMGLEGRFKSTESITEEPADEAPDSIPQKHDYNKTTIDSRLHTAKLKSHSLLAELPTVDSSGTYSLGSFDCYAVESGNPDSLDIGETQDEQTRSVIQQDLQRGAEELNTKQYKTTGKKLVQKDFYGDVEYDEHNLLERGQELRLVDTVTIPSAERLFSNLLHNSYRTLKQITLDNAIFSTIHQTSAFHDAAKAGFETIDWQCCGDSCLVPTAEKSDILSIKPRQLDVRPAQSPACKIMFWCDDKGKSKLTITSPRSIFGEDRKSNSITFDADELKERLSHWRENGTRSSALLLNYKTRDDDDNEDESQPNDKACKLVDASMISKATEKHEAPKDDDSCLDLDLSILSASFDEQSKKASTPSSISTFRIENDVERPFNGPLDTTTSRESTFFFDNANLKDEELRTVMKLTRDGEELSIIFPAISCESIGDGDSDDGLSDEMGALSDLQDNLRAALEVAAKRSGGQLPLLLTSPLGSPYIQEQMFSSDSSMAHLSEVNQSSSHEAPSVRASTPFARRVRFDDEVQEFLYVSEIYPDAKREKPRKPFESKYDKDDSLLGEIMSSVEFILDEMAFACTSASTMFKGKKKKIKRTKITRSSAYDHY